MLALTRRIGETILVGGKIQVTVIRIDHNSVRLGISAPRDVHIVREELDGLLPALLPDECHDCGQHLVLECKCVSTDA